MAESLRLFRGISEDLFKTGENTGTPEQTADQKVADFLLSSAGRKLGFWERLRPGRLSALNRIGLLPGVFRKAFEAELAGEWRRADFYWNELRRTFESLNGRAELWNAAVADAAHSLGLENPGSGNLFRLALVGEVFYQAHGAFYSASVGNGTGPRADFHLKRMAWLLPYTGLGQEERNRLSRAIHEQAQACAKAKQWSRAISLTELLIEGEKDNGDYQELLIFCTHSATMERMAALKAEPAAAELAKGISALEALRSRFPRQLAVFQALGTEHHLRAVQLANSHQLSLALDEAVRASAFDPEQDGLADTTKKLNEMMAQLQARVKDLLQEIRFRPNVRLSADGLRMKTQAERGFAPANQWAESAEASAVASARHEAYVSSIWRRVGLAPQAENAIGKAEALIAGLSQVIQAAPGSGPEIASEWERVSANISELADVDHEAVIRWLNRRLLADSVEPETPAPASGYPALRIAANPANKGEEDLQDWLVSPKGIRIKTQIAAACVFLLIAVFFAGSNVRSLSVRDAAWKQMQASAAASDDNGMVQAGELYFSTSSPAGEEKGRSEAAAEMYSRALVRWYAAHSSESADQAAARVNLFRVRVSNKGYLNANEAGGPQ